MKLIIGLLIVINGLTAQVSTYYELSKFHDDWFEPFEYEHTLCPWQSFRLVPNVSMQIDVVCDSVALKVLQAEPYLFLDGLEKMYNYYPLGRDNVELFRRYDDNPRSYKAHIPGLLAPYNRYYRIVRASEAIDITKNPYNGWYYKPMKNETAIAIKQISNNKYQVSGALFLRGIVPEFDKMLDSLITFMTKQKERLK